MALEIFRLVGSILVDNTKANESIQKTDSKAAQVGKTFLKGVGAVAKWGAGIVSAASAAVGAMVGVAAKAATAADEVDKASQRVGISAESYQKLRYAADLSGVSTSNLETAAKKLKSTDPSATLDETLIRLAGITDESQRAAEAEKLFGKSAYNLTPLLNAGADGIKDMMTECESLGLVMSGDTVKAGAAFNDTITKIKSAGSALVNSIGAKFIPFLEKAGNMILGLIPKVTGLVDKAAPILTGMLETLLPPLMELGGSILPPILGLVSSVIPVLSEIASAIIPPLIQLLNMLLPPAVTIVSTILPLLLSLIQPLLPLLQPIIELLQPVIDLLLSLLAPLTDLINMLLPPIINLLVQIISAVLPPLQKALTFTANVISAVFSQAIKDLAPVIENVKGIFKGVIDFVKNVFTGNWRGAWEAVVSIFKNIWDGIKNAAKVPINGVITMLNKFIGGLNKIKIPDWVPGLGGKGIHISTIPMLAEGGVIAKAGRAIVGERGAELVELPKGAKVTPLKGSDGRILSDEETLKVLYLILQELKSLGSSLYDIIVDALVNGVKLDWSDRELARLVRKYAP